MRSSLGFLLAGTLAFGAAPALAGGDGVQSPLADIGPGPGNGDLLILGSDDIFVRDTMPPPPGSLVAPRNPNVNTIIILNLDEGDRLPPQQIRDFFDDRGPGPVAPPGFADYSAFDTVP